MRSHEGEGPKQFKVGFRGYRREPVDEYVERLHQWLVDSEARADQAVEAATVAVGERASDILRAALAVGTQADEEAETLKAAAVENAHAEAERMMKDAHLQIEALQQSIDQLAIRRANVVSELGRLQKYLAGAAGTPRDIDFSEDDEIDAVMSAEPDTRPTTKNGDRPVSKSV
jgi:cell division septum initiation protein DivIVA